MSTTGTEALAAFLETQPRLDAAGTTAVLDMLSHVLPREQPRPDQLTDTESVLHLVDTALPGWTIHLTGRAMEPNGHWACQLRPAETGDNDEFIGHGAGPGIATALLAALLRVMDWKTTR